LYEAGFVISDSNPEIVEKVRQVCKNVAIGLQQQLLTHKRTNDYLPICFKQLIEDVYVVTSSDLMGGKLTSTQELEITDVPRGWLTLQLHYCLKELIDAISQMGGPDPVTYLTQHDVSQLHPEQLLLLLTCGCCIICFKYTDLCKYAELFLTKSTNMNNLFEPVIQWLNHHEFLTKHSYEAQLLRLTEHCVKPTLYKLGLRYFTRKDLIFKQPQKHDNEAYIIGVDGGIPKNALVANLHQYKIDGNNPPKQQASVKYPVTELVIFDNNGVLLFSSKINGNQFTASCDEVVFVSSSSSSSSSSSGSSSGSIQATIGTIGISGDANPSYFTQSGAFSIILQSTKSALGEAYKQFILKIQNPEHEKGTFGSFLKMECGMPYVGTDGIYGNNYVKTVDIPEELQQEVLSEFLKKYIGDKSITTSSLLQVGRVANNDQAAFAAMMEFLASLVWDHDNLSIQKLNSETTGIQLSSEEAKYFDWLTATINAVEFAYNCNKSGFLIPEYSVQVFNPPLDANEYDQ
jgi:hypothetical protein